MPLSSSSSAAEAPTHSNVLLMDTEGIDALDAECEHDVRVFALAVLMCSVLVYNSMSHLDEASVQTLSLMTSVADAVESRHTPMLYWVLRDFALELVDASGEPMTTDQYLKQALEPPAAPAAATSSGSSSSSKCATRDAILRVFAHSRFLMTLPAPASTKGRSNSKFERAVGAFRSHMCAHAPPFTADGVPLSGAVYVEFVRSIVSRVNECGVIPKVRDSWTLIARVQHADAERAVRSEVVRSASECVRGTEDEVRAWATERVRARVRATQFVAPRPDEDAVVCRVTDELVHHCVALGRVVDDDEAARAIVDDFFSAAAAAADDDDDGRRGGRDMTRASELLRFLELSSISALSSSVRARALELFYHRVLTAIVPALERRAYEDGATLEMQRLELEQGRVRLEELLQLEVTESARAPPACAAYEHAYVQTEAAAEDAAVAVSSDEEDDGRVRLVLRVQELEASVARLELLARSSEERVVAVRAACDGAMTELRRTTVDRIRKIATERDDAVASARSCAERRAAVEAECEKMRAVAKEAQQRTLEVHKSTLDELQRRDVQAREAADMRRKEWGDGCARTERSVQEVSSLKRRVDELLEMADEVKRVRASNAELTLERARAEVHVAMLHSHLDAERARVDALSRSNAELSNRVAVLEVSCKLDECKQSLL